MNIVKTRRDLFDFISKSNLPENKRKEYLEYLFNQTPLISSELAEFRDFLGYSVADRKITVGHKSLPLKSFFEGKKGVKFIRNKSSCFETQILPFLPVEYTPQNSFTAARFDLDGRSILIPYVNFDGTHENLLATEGFSLHDMLAVFLVGIQQDEKFFIRKQKRSIIEVALGPGEPFFSQMLLCNPFDPTGKFTYLNDFSVSYRKEEGAWEVLFWNGGD